MTRRTNLFQPRDFAWLLFAAALIVFDPETNYSATIVIVCIGAFQIAEPRLRWFSSRHGQLASIGIKLILSYLLIGYSHPIDSFYYLIFLIPIISAATVFNFLGVMAVTAIASLAYFSFVPLLFVYWKEYVAQGQISVMLLRVSFFAIVAYVVYEQASGKRKEMKRTEEAAERLAESNRNLRAAEASLRRSERLAALGQLTAGLAHELRNPLGTIKASAEMLTRDATKARPEVMSEMTGYIVSEVDRVNGLIASFLDFAKPLQIRAVPADLRSTMEDVVRQQSDLAARRNVGLSVRMDAGPLSFTFDPDLLKLAISNLVQNAIEASRSGQTVEIRVENRDENVMLFVTDHGEGIQSQHLESIFNPFFTTKPHGTGLGLAIVSKIIDEHEGRILVFSEAGAGTTFEVTLPKGQQI